MKDDFLPELTKGTIIMSRVRLARNVNSLPFCIEDENSAKEVVKKVYRALSPVDTFNLYYVNNLTDTQLESMKESHLISQNLIDNKKTGAALINGDKSISIMINEEDVIREQCFMRGLKLEEAYQKLQKTDDAITRNIDIAFDEEYGYLTNCISNMGTGLRASVMMFLPALSQSGQIASLMEEMKEIGLTVRGVYGEGSKAEGYIYQISNEITLGVSEEEIIETVESAVIRICDAEQDYSRRIFSKHEIEVLDRAKKSYGILTNAVLLSYSEFLDNVANIKVGAILGLFDLSDIDGLDDLIVKVRAANLCEHFGKNLSAFDRDLYRAELVGEILTKLKEN
ncbi:MAG: ATP--guanido phosphotransferase [Clostridia bacterium]|nr:ATP--guanido phosphotransferase [Clostridia bacterium]